MLALLLLPVSGISLIGGQLTIRTLFIVYLVCSAPVLKVLTLVPNCQILLLFCGHYQQLPFSLTTIKVVLYSMFLNDWVQYKIICCFYSTALSDTSF